MPQTNAETTGTPVTIAEIRRKFEKLVPWRRGKSGRKNLGVFKIKPEVVRSLYRNDLPVIMHELGHFLEKKLDLGKAVKKVIDSSREQFVTYFNEQEKQKKRANQKYEIITKAPYVELINAGDDITVLTSGRYALSVAANILRLFNKQGSPFGDGSKLSASAGVVIFHSHYPFSKAYKLAEDCCASAKKPTRKEPDAGKSYIDFVLLQGGAVVDLDDLRKRQYTVKGETITQRQCRPWQVGGNEPIGFEWFERQQREWVIHESDAKEREGKWARGKQKALREAIALRDGSAEFVLEQMRSRKLNLPKELLKENNGLCEGWQRIMFDILEVADVFESIGVIQ
jgi:hypothetical protein